MAIQLIDLGIAPNDNLGDKLRVGGQKINANFTEVYNKLFGGLSDTDIANTSSWSGATVKLALNTIYASKGSWDTAYTHTTITGNPHSTAVGDLTNGEYVVLREAAPTSGRFLYWDGTASRAKTGIISALYRPDGSAVALEADNSSNLSSTGTVTATRFISTVATGTAPLTVTSTTEVANLRAATASRLPSIGTAVADANVHPGIAGFLYANISGTTANYPTSAGGSWQFFRGTTPNLGDVQFFKSSAANEVLYIRTLSSTSPLTFNSWRVLQHSGNSNLSTVDWNAQKGIFSDVIRQTTQSTPASATATGVKGDICHDTNYIYVCTATNTWKRVAIATW